jgi:hypothetical protein
MPDNASEAAGSAAGTFLGKLRAWKPRCCKKPLTRNSASEVGTTGAPIDEIQPSLPEHKSKQMVQFGGVQHYNNYPGNVGQQMLWTYHPQHGLASASHGNATAFPYSMNWNQQEEAVTSFAVGSYQGYHGFSVSLKPETFLSLSPDQQAAIVNLGRGNNFNSIVAPFPPPKAPITLDPEPPTSVIEEIAPEPLRPAMEEQSPKCVECDKQIMINILPQQCHAVPLCGPCYHSSVRQYAVFSTGRHTC